MKSSSRYLVWCVCLLLLATGLDGCRRTKRHGPSGPSFMVTVDSLGHRDTIYLQTDSTAETYGRRSLDGNRKVLYNPDQLVGEWISGTLHDTYYGDGTGLSWDTADDVDITEAQRFTWTLENNLLVQLHRMEIGDAVIPKQFKLTLLDDSNLVMEGSFGEVILWERAGQPEDGQVMVLD